MASISNYSYNTIPPNNRVPGTWIEFAPARGVFAIDYRALLVVQRTAEAVGALADGPIQITGDGSMAAQICGRGSEGHLAVKAFREQNRVTDLWIILLPDAESGTAASGTITFAGSAEEARQGVLYIANSRVPFAIAEDDTAEEIAASAGAAIAANLDLPVTASVTGAVVTVTARNKGAVGNDMTIKKSWRRGEDLAAGVTMTISGVGGHLTGGSGNPDIAPVIAALQARDFDFIGVVSSDDYTLDLLDDEMARRWSAQQQQWSLVFSCARGTPAELNLIGQERNSPFMSVVGLLEGSPVPAFMRMAHYFGECVWKLIRHPARPIGAASTLVGEEEIGSEFMLTYSDKQMLLSAGISLVLADERTGAVHISKTITTYQTNAFGDDDDSWHMLQTPATCALVGAMLRHHINTNILQPEPILAGEKDRLGLVPHVTDGMVETDCVALYAEMEKKGLVGSLDYFKRGHIRVGRSGETVDRLNIMFDPDLQNPLYQVGCGVNFYLNYPESL